MQAFRLAPPGVVGSSCTKHCMPLCVRASRNLTLGPVLVNLINIYWTLHHHRVAAISIAIAG